jgi:hypothetical protein
LDFAELEEFLDEALERHEFFWREGKYLIDTGFSDSSACKNLLIV